MAGSEIPPEAVEAGAVAIAHEETGYEVADDQDRKTVAIALHAALEVCPVLGLDAEQLRQVRAAVDYYGQRGAGTGTVDTYLAMKIKLERAAAVLSGSGEAEEG